VWVRQRRCRLQLARDLTEGPPGLRCATELPQACLPSLSRGSMQHHSQPWSLWSLLQHLPPRIGASDPATEVTFVLALVLALVLVMLLLLLLLVLVLELLAHWQER